MIKFLIFSVILILPHCGPCDPETYDMGPLSDQALKIVPYRDADEITLAHSKGQEIHFDISRNTVQKEEYLCGGCCDQYLFEENITSLEPDYPALQTRIYLSNMDSAYITARITINNTWFEIPVNDYQILNANIIDSMLVNNQYYYHVFALKSSNFNNDDVLLYIDSLYYNYNAGILKVTLSNDEYYQIRN